VRIRATPSSVIVAVIDTGIGIPPENLERIFNHGFTTRTDGHGFGLHSSALAARELGGSLYATSAGTGEGATFTLTLPLTHAESRHGE
jgi:signal transduction histidine kinase